MYAAAYMVGSSMGRSHNHQPLPPQCKCNDKGEAVNCPKEVECKKQ
jgi:hypothetical protein